MSTEIVYEPVASPKAVPTVKPPRNRAGRKSEAERITAKAENMVLARQHSEEARAAERRALIESKRAVRHQPDTKHSQRAALILASVPLVTAGIVSYFTTVAVAQWMALPLPWLDFVVPGMLEALVIFSSLDFIINESRKKGSGRPAFWAMIAFSAVNVLGNSAHTIVTWGPSFGGSNWQSYIGVALSGAAPFVVVYLSKRLSTLIFAESE